MDVCLTADKRTNIACAATPFILVCVSICNYTIAQKLVSYISGGTGIFFKFSERITCMGM